MAFMMDFSTICRPGREKGEPSSAQHTLFRTRHPSSHLAYSLWCRVSSPAPPGHRWNKPYDIPRTPNCLLPAAHHPYGPLCRALGRWWQSSGHPAEHLLGAMRAGAQGGKPRQQPTLFIHVPAEETLQKDEISPDSSPGRIHPQPSGQGAGPQSWQGAPRHRWAGGDVPPGDTGWSPPIVTRQLLPLPFPNFHPTSPR